MPEHTPAPTPSRAVYGFVMYLSFKIFLITYLLWAIIPGKYFEMIGIDFLPQRYWAVSIPILILTGLNLFAFVIYPSMGQHMTPDVDDLRTITDIVGKKRKQNGEKLAIETKMGDSLGGGNCVCIRDDKCFKKRYEHEQFISGDRGIHVVRDLDIWDVSERLYLNKKNV